MISDQGVTLKLYSVFPPVNIHPPSFRSSLLRMEKCVSRLLWTGPSGPLISKDTGISRLWPPLLLFRCGLCDAFLKPRRRPHVIPSLLPSRSLITTSTELYMHHVAWNLYSLNTKFPCPLSVFLLGGWSIGWDCDGWRFGRFRHLRLVSADRAPPRGVDGTWSTHRRTSIQPFSRWDGENGVIVSGSGARTFVVYTIRWPCDGFMDLSTLISLRSLLTQCIYEFCFQPFWRRLLGTKAFVLGTSSRRKEQKKYST